MMWRQAIASALQFFAVFGFIVIGISILVLPYLPEARTKVVHLLLYDCEICSWVGLGVLFAAFLFLIGFYGLNRGRFLSLQMGGHLAKTHLAVLRETLDDCFKTHFPKRLSLEKIEVISDKKLEIGVCVAPQTGKELDLLFAAAEKELEVLLRKRFGYTAPFSLTIRSTRPF